MKSLAMPSFAFHGSESLQQLQLLLSSLNAMEGVECAGDEQDRVAR